MTISIGETLPEASFLIMDENGPEAVDLAPRLAGRKVVIFGLPGAFTGTCSNAHLPSFMRTKAEFDAKGVDEVICVAVNDPFVMTAWGESTGATAAGISMLADADGSFTSALGLSFDAPPAGFFGRAQRFALLAEDGVVTRLQLEAKPGVFEATSGEALLAAL